MLFASEDEDETLDMLRSRKNETSAANKAPPKNRDADFDSDDDMLTKNKGSAIKATPVVVQPKNKPAFMESDEEDDRKMSMISSTSFSRQLVHGRDQRPVSSAVEALRGKLGSIKLITPEEKEKVRSTSKSAKNNLGGRESVTSNSENLNNDLLLGKATASMHSKKPKKKANFFNDSDGESEEELPKSKSKSPPAKTEVKKTALFDDSFVEVETKVATNLSVISQNAKTAASKRLQDLFPDEDLDDY